MNRWKVWVSDTRTERGAYIREGVDFETVKEAFEVNNEG